MHARKLPRISEPSFDRDYGNGSSGSRAYRDRSPSDVASRSPRDRSKYGRRDRDNRDYYKYSRGSRDRRDRSPKDRKWESSSRRDRSPKDRKWDRGDQRMDHRGDHHHQPSSGSSSMANSAPPLESKLRSVGDWTEHTSSSGKKYYYNSVSEVSRNELFFYKDFFQIFFVGLMLERSSIDKS